MSTFSGTMRRILLAAVIALVPLGCTEPDFDKGLAAYDAGDYATALKEWRPLAEQGDAAAQSNLGLMYQRGNGVTQDYAEAMRWYRLAAETGYGKAQYYIGNMYHRGEGVAKDLAEALRWYVSAYMWLSIEFMKGDNRHRKFRERVAELLTREQVAEAERRARVCMESNYKDCD